MPYIGNTIRAADDYRLIDDISSGFNGSATSFALQVAGSAPVPFPKSPQQVLISVNGVIQEPDPTGASGFNLVGTNIVFSSAPTNGHAFFGIIYATADYLNAGGNFPSGSLGAPSFTFIGDENTGLYRKSGGSVGFVSDATEIANFDSNGITISSGNLIIPDSIIHNGDTDTKIRFGSANEFSVETGGVERLELTGTETVFNDTGADTDFRIEGDTNANLFKLDAGNDRVGIGTASPQQVFHVYHAADNGLARFESGDANCRVDLVDNSGQVSIEAIGDQLKIGRTSSNTESFRIASDGQLTHTYDITSNGDAGLILNTDDGTKASSILFRANSETRARIDVQRLAGDGAQLKLQVSQMNNTNTLLDCVTFAPNSSGDTTPNATFNGNLFANADSTHDIGSNTVRWANGYFDTLYGDGSNLTGVTSTTINNNADNRVITGSGTANTLEGEANLTFDGSTLLVTDASLRISSATPTIDLMDSSTNPDYSISNNDGVFRIRDLTNTNNAFLINTTDITVARNIIPYASNTYNLGSSSYRWANLFVNDLNMSNKGKQNEVDGTWGDYTIQEGHEDLFLINHRTGKKFKFNLTEVG